MGVNITSLFHCLWSLNDKQKSLKSLEYNNDRNIEVVGKLFKFDYHCSLFKNNKEYHYRKNIDVILCENTTVFWWCRDFNYRNPDNNFDFVNISNHDSCWITSLNDQFFKVYCESSDYINKESGYNIVPKMQNANLSLDNIYNVNIVREKEVEFKKKLVSYKFV